MHHGRHIGVLLSWLIVSLSLQLPSSAGEDTTLNVDNEKAVHPGQVDVVVIGCAHLMYLDPSDVPATDDILRALQEYEPDHMVVEWLHPSIDPASVDRYEPLGDLGTLARLWGYDLVNVEATLAETRTDLDSLKANGLPEAAIRIEMGKLYYLGTDQLNAGYQWWIARNLGANVKDLERLTQNNFEGHELEVFGFAIARREGLEYITPFDYEGEDALWDFGAVLNRTVEHAIKTKHGLKDGDKGFDEVAGEFGKAFQAWLNSGDGAFLDQYGSIKEIVELVRFFDDRKKTEEANQRIKDATGIAAMRFNQSAEHMEQERHGYYDVIAGLSIDGLGRRLVGNFELRNRYMVDFLEQDIRELGSKRVMVIVGAGHKLFLEKILRERGYRIVPSMDFMP
ncbi:MAG: hypothetical protein K8R59_05185 [Thermoanaerobaculales bacterium]|nr:hypothetical protein [Thermoanaerobaculales bacterium]